MPKTPNFPIVTVLRQHLINLRSSFWFLPGLMVLGCIVLALILILAEFWLGAQVFDGGQGVFSIGPEGARGILSVIASSMISVTGIVFSITLVALTLSASQYTPRVLRNFMRDRLNQVVLGVFVGIFAYAMVVLFTIRDVGEGLFVPSLAVLMGLLLGLVGIGFLVFYIHHIAVSIQASQILAAVYQDTRETVDRMYPQALEEGTDSGPVVDGGAHRWHPLSSRHTGYIQQMDLEALCRFAEDHQTLIRVERGVGDFIMEDMPILWVADAQAPDRETQEQLHGMYLVDRQRTVEQDVAFGIRQLVDIALKGLSPGINDTTTAVMSIDYLTALLACLGERRIDCQRCDEQGRSRLLNCGPDYGYLLGKALDQIRQSAEGNPAVLSHLLGSLQLLAGRTRVSTRRRALLQQALALAEVCGRSIVAPGDRQHLEALSTRLIASLQDDSARSA